MKTMIRLTLLKSEELTKLKGGVLYCPKCPYFGSSSCKTCHKDKTTDQTGTLR